MKKILILSFYYSPDLSAGSFRTEALITALQPALLSNEILIDIITTMPNRYQQFQKEALKVEKHHHLTIHRINLPAHRNAFLDQIKAFTHYFLQARKMTQQTHYDIVFATSSRLFTAFLGATIANKKKCPLFLDIRDIFTETMASVLKFPLKPLCLPWLYFIERYTLKQANKLNLVSEGFLPYFKNKISTNCEVTTISNGIDTCFKENNYHKSVCTSTISIKRIIYAGNIGEGQGLDKIIPKLAQATLGQCEFVIIGSGGQLNTLQETSRPFENIKILPPMARAELTTYYQTADILFLHLNNYPAFKRVLPSKIFEYAAIGKPILAGVPGYSAEFIKEHIPGSWLFPPCDTNLGITKLFEILANNIQHYDREAFCQQFSRDKLMSALAKHLLEM